MTVTRLPEFKHCTCTSSLLAQTYVVRGMSFSPDSAKLAIAQSDNIVFIYKLGLEWWVLHHLFLSL